MFKKLLYYYYTGPVLPVQNGHTRMNKSSINGILVKLLSTKKLISIGDQMATSEIRKQFQARFGEILIISEPFGERNYSIFEKTQVKLSLFLKFTSIPFDYLLISWVTNYV